MIVGLYARVSTNNGKQDATNQLLQLREFCHKQNWSIGTEYVDNISGKASANRPGFVQMMQDASQRRFDLLLFWSLDRLSREGALATLTHLSKLSSYGIKYRSFTESYLDTLGPFGDVVVSLLACIARQERTRLSERVTAGLERARAAGRIGGRRHALTIDKQNEARRLRAAGLSFGVIADKLFVSKPTIMRVCKGE